MIVVDPSDGALYYTFGVVAIPLSGTAAPSVFLLLETGDKTLLETGDKLRLEA